MGLSLMKLCEGQPSKLVFRRDSERVVVSSGNKHSLIDGCVLNIYIFSKSGDGTVDG